MSRRVVVACKGLFIRKTNERYREVTSLEFLHTNNLDIDEINTLNPIVFEGLIPQSLPGEAIKIVEQRLPSNLLELRDCFEFTPQENLEPFVYKGKHYIFLENVLNQIVAEKEVG